jgi:hypothetical protein
MRLASTFGPVVCSVCRTMSIQRCGTPLSSWS